MKLTSAVIEEGAHVPVRFTCDGEDVSPPLEVAGVPADAKSLAVVLDDPDAPSGTFVHWLIWNLPADLAQLPGGVAGEPTVRGIGADVHQGTNSFGKVGYGGPCPPRGRGAHHYRFQLYALDAMLSLDAGARRDALDRAMAGHILASDTLTALYAH